MREQKKEKKKERDAERVINRLSRCRDRHQSSVRETEIKERERGCCERRKGRMRERNKKIDVERERERSRLIEEKEIGDVQTENNESTKK